MQTLPEFIRTSILTYCPLLPKHSWRHRHRHRHRHSQSSCYPPVFLTSAPARLLCSSKFPSNSSSSSSNPPDTSAANLFDDVTAIEIEIEKLGNNFRRIRSKAVVRASLQTLWNILTDYEKLSDFIPGLAVSQLLDKRDNFARLFQIGQQNLAFGLNFNAKGVVDCYEKDIESLPHGQRRDIEFKMIEGDFQLFEGKWSIEECRTGRLQESGSLACQEFLTTLSYVVDVKPKMWLPVRLVESKLCREIKLNLSCIREAAERASRDNLPAH